jgi:hypothetical protein
MFPSNVYADGGMSAADWEATGYGLGDELRCGNSVDIPVDDFWQISGIFGRNRGDIHRLPGREWIAKPLAEQGFSSLVLPLIPWRKGISNLVPSTTRPPLRTKKTTELKLLARWPHCWQSLPGVKCPKVPLWVTWPILDGAMTVLASRPHRARVAAFEKVAYTSSVTFRLECPNSSVTAIGSVPSIRSVDAKLCLSVFTRRSPARVSATINLQILNIG